jgi:hypothetical protein
MKKLSFALFLGIALLMLAPNASAQCAPAGGGTTGPSVSWFNYTANGIPNGTTDCWNPRR